MLRAALSKGALRTIAELTCQYWFRLSLSLSEQGLRPEDRPVYRPIYDEAGSSLIVYSPNKALKLHPWLDLIGAGVDYQYLPLL